MLHLAFRRPWVARAVAAVPTLSQTPRTFSALAPLTIYHVPNTRGFRAIWLCEELGLQYRLEPVDFSAEYRASAEWRAMNPVGKVPVMVDGDLKLFESGAIVQHILDQYGDGRLQPQHGSKEHGHYLQWSWFAEATFSRATGELANHRRAFAGSLIETVMEEMRGRARSCLHAVDTHLATSAFMVGDSFTAADIMIGYALQSFERNVGDAPLPSNVQAYWERVQARPAFKAASAANLALSTNRG